MTPLDPARWERAQQVFHAALELPRAGRAAFVSQSCADDARLAREVMAMLAADEATESPLDAGLAAAAHELLDERESVGRQLGPYTIGEPLGEGGTSVVYRARRTDVGSTVAIKVLRAAWVSPTRQRRFLAEQRTLAALDHPNIARLLDARTLEDGTPCFVMEYVDGVPITDYCVREQLTLARRLELFRAVCDAVQHAHAHAIVHRDIKPSNVLVTADGQPKLLDFGIAKQLDEQDADETFTRLGLRPMTPAYAAPEQTRGEPVGVYTDVYALGALLHEMLTGRRPSTDATEGSAPGSEGDVPGSVSRSERTDIESIRSVAMHELPSRRYASADALARDVDRFLRGLPLEARPDSLAYRAGKFLRRNRGPVIATAAAVTLIVAGSLLHAARLSAAKARAELEAQKARQVTDYLVGIFEAADPYADPDTDVRTILDRGEAQVEGLGDTPELQAELLGVLGRVRVALSDYDRAETMLTRALDLHRSHSPPHALAATLVDIGRLFYHTGRYEDGILAMREAVSIRATNDNDGGAALAEALDELGVLTSSNGDYAGADTLYARALAIRRTLHVGPHADLGTSLNNVAVNAFNLGRFDVAAAHYEEALSVERQVYGADHPSVATTLANFGKLHEQTGRYDEAEKLLTEALRIRRARLGDDHFETALSLSQLGGLLQQAGHLDRAESVLREALAARERLLGTDHPSVGTTLNAVGLLLTQQGRNDEAVTAFRRVIAIYAAALGPEHRFTGVAIGNHAAALQASGRVTDAEREYRRSIAILSAVHPETHPELGWNVARLGMLLADVLRDEEADPLLRRAHPVLLEAYGPEHQRTRDVAASLERIGQRRAQ